MRRIWFWCSVSLLLTWAPSLAPAAGAATVLDRSVSVTIRPDGVVSRQTSLRVRLETADDLDSWSVYSIPLNSNRSLAAVRAFAVLPDGRQVKVRRKDQDTGAYSGSSLHSSQRLHRLEFSGLTVGAELDIEYDVEEEPYYPADRILLAGDEDVERLEVVVRGGGDAWRWGLGGPAGGFEIEETAGGVAVTASHVPAVDPPALAPNNAIPVLRYAWGREGTWRAVGSWYAELLDSLPRRSEAVRSQARALTADAEGGRQRLEALLAFTRRKVRYVAVQVGVGGYLPSSPAEVLERKWGDCKDKSLLLIDLLAESGIEAYPALILADDERRLDVGFPAPDQFNHLIVAVPSAAVATAEDDPVSDGYLFVDPTQERGSGRWLHPSDQDQDVLVVHGGTGTLAHTPIRHRAESRRLQLTLHVTPEGEARGGVGLELRGRLASAFIEQIAAAPPERTEEDARAIFSALLPGVTVRRVGWTEDGDDVPKVDMSASVRLDRLVEGVGSRPSFKLSGMRLTPEPRWLEERDVPVVLTPRSTEITWHLILPEGWCLPQAREERVENEVGVFVQSVTPEPGKSRVTVERKVELRRRWIEPEMLPAAYELALAEHRAHRRRIRLECE